MDVVALHLIVHVFIYHLLFFKFIILCDNHCFIRSGKCAIPLYNNVQKLPRLTFWNADINFLLCSLLTLLCAAVSQRHSACATWKWQRSWGASGHISRSADFSAVELSVINAAGACRTTTKNWIARLAFFYYVSRIWHRLYDFIYVWGKVKVLLGVLWLWGRGDSLQAGSVIKKLCRQKCSHTAKPAWQATILCYPDPSRKGHAQFCRIFNVQSRVIKNIFSSRHFCVFNIEFVRHYLY